MKTYQKPHAKTKRILAYRLSHPKATVRGIANSLTMTYGSVYNCLFKYDALRADNLDHLKTILGDFSESKMVEPAVTPTTGQEVLRKEVLRLNTVNMELTQEVEMLNIVIKATAVQRRGLENVIQYLEAKLGIDEIDSRLESTKD